MNYEEFKDRFIVLNCYGRDRKNAEGLILSNTAYLAIPEKPDDSHYTPLGRFKLRAGRVFKVVRLTEELGFKTELLYKAMLTVRRRTHFELGLWRIQGRDVFAIREGEFIVIIAPNTMDGDDKDVIIPFSQLVTHVNKNFMEKYKTWNTILTGRKIK